MSGNLGLSPGTSVTGFGPGLISGGVQNVANPAAAQAKSDLVTAYDDAAGQPPATPVAASDPRRTDAERPASTAAGPST